MEIALAPPIVNRLPHYTVKIVLLFERDYSQNNRHTPHGLPFKDQS